MKSLKKTMRMAGVFAAAGMLASVSVSGFAEERDPWQVYEEAAALQNELDSMGMSVDVSVGVSGLTGEEPLYFSITMDCQMAGLQSQALQMALSMDYTLEGEELEDAQLLSGMNMYYTDGTYYMDMGDLGKLKYDMNMEEVLSQVENLNLMEINKEAIRELTLEEDGETTILNYSLNTETANSLIFSLLGELESLIGSTEDSEAVKITNCTGTMTLNADGYIENQDMDMEMTMALDEETDVYFSIAMDMDILNGEDVTVELPEDLDGYIDYEDLLSEMESIETEALTEM